MNTPQTISPTEDECRQCFARELRTQRQAAQLSRAYVAEKSGFDPSYVARLEHASRTPTQGAVLRLARALGATPRQRDRLLMAANFLPGDLSSLLSSQPEIAGALSFIRANPDCEEARWLREHIAAALAVARNKQGTSS